MTTLNPDLLKVDEDYPVFHYENHYIKKIFLPSIIKIFNKDSIPSINDFLSRLSYDQRKQSFENLKPAIAKTLQEIAALDDIVNQIQNYFLNISPAIAYHIMNTAVGKLHLINDNLNIERITIVPKDIKKTILFLCDSNKPLIVFPNGGFIVLKY